MMEWFGRFRVYRHGSAGFRGERGLNGVKGRDIIREKEYIQKTIMNSLFKKKADSGGLNTWAPRATGKCTFQENLGS